MKKVASGLAIVVVAASSYAQDPRPVGSVVAADATVTGVGDTLMPIAAGRSTITGSAMVTARAGKNANVALVRGGSLLVCQTTAVRVTSADGDSLLLALDRGALELRAKGGVGDLIMTPDLSFTLTEPGPLDLRMRVTFNGDTCVENRGHKAPPLNIKDAFGETSYLLKPGQHVMFEHGSLREVMDRESTPCGCPPDAEPTGGVSVADAILSGGRSTAAAPAAQQEAAATHPFPEAVSDGLATPPPPVPEMVGERHVQVASTLTFSPGDVSPGTPAPVTAAPVAAQPPPQPQKKSGPFGAFGRFFKRVFVR